MRLYVAKQTDFKTHTILNEEKGRVIVLRLDTLKGRRVMITLNVRKANKIENTLVFWFS